jgi:hypothetical protein
MIVDLSTGLHEQIVHIQTPGYFRILLSSLNKSLDVIYM